MKFSFAALLCFCLLQLNAQHIFRAMVKDSATRELLTGVTVVLKSNEKVIAASDAKGQVILKNLPAGRVFIVFSYVGYKPVELLVYLPDTVTHTVLMQQDAVALSKVVVVAATRSNDRIENATTKVEVLGQEEMNEESTIKPGNIASILGDVSGVQIQQSSATSGNANVRIQGLGGRYTQILRDGMPLYGGYSGGFGILSIPPLDLKQIELIKGSSSTLYGGGAIGGLVNLVSKKPLTTPDASFLINQTTLKETNVNAYYAQRWKKAGFTFFSGYTFQEEADVNKDGLSDVPYTNSVLIHPVLYIYPSSKSYISLGWSGSFENRKGGDMVAVDGKQDAAHPYFEKNKLSRNIFTLISESHLGGGLTASVKGSLSIFGRDETTNTYLFNAKQENYYAEASLIKRTGSHIIVGGLNVTGDKFKPDDATPAPVGSFSNTTEGVFLQDSWQMLKSTKLETGLRIDHHDKYGNFALPRIALFHHINEAWGARAGFGMGYTTPNPLTSQIRDYSIYQIMPVAPNVTPEKSYGANAEVNYKKEFEKGSLFINQAFFVTQITHPIVGTEDALGNLSFDNKDKPVLTMGSDTYAQVHLDNWEFYLGYTYTDARRKYLSGNQFMPITPHNRAAATVLYEKEGSWRIGMEASYNGYQYREDNSKTPAYLFMAAMFEKKFGPKWSLVLNCENLLDERQSRHESLYTGPISDPNYKTLWAPIDGRVANLCLRFQPFAKAE